MSGAKRPPPDSPGNLDGRELALRQHARQLTLADARAGVDFAKARARRAAEIEPEIAKLRRRRELLNDVTVPDDFLAGMASLNDL